MEFVPDSLVAVKEARFSETIQPLGVFVVRAYVVRQRVAPRSHLRGGHRQIKRALLARVRLQRRLTRRQSGHRSVFTTTKNEIVIRGVRKCPQPTRNAAEK